MVYYKKIENLKQAYVDSIVLQMDSSIKNGIEKELNRKKLTLVDEFVLVDIVNDLNMYGYAEEKIFLLNQRTYEMIYYQDLLRIEKPEIGTTEHKVLEVLEMNYNQNKNGAYELDFMEQVAYLDYIGVDKTDFVVAVIVPQSPLLAEISGIISKNLLLISAMLLSLLAFFYHVIGVSEKTRAAQKKSDFALSVSNLLIIETDSGGQIIDANEQSSLVLGYLKEEFTNYNIKELFVSGLQDDNVKTFTMPIHKKNGEEVHVLWNIATEINTGNLEYFGSDITELEDSQERIRHLAYYDILTGLKNRIALEKFIVELLEQENALQFALLFIDIDNFKYINSAFDYNFGDMLLIAVVDRIEKINHVNEEKVNLFRIGGDEFAVVYLGYNGYKEVEDYASSIIKAVGEAYTCENSKISITVSIGISFCPGHADRFEEMYKIAEIALDDAKKFGIGRISVFNEDMKRKAESAANMLSDMEEALNKKEYHLYYQPQYNIKTGEFCGYEALMRWISPVRGFVPPSVFIPYAEKSRLIMRLGKWALEEACDFVNELCSLGHHGVQVSVNVSSVQLTDDDFVEVALETIREKGTSPECIQFELTESVMMESVEASLVKVRELNSAGIVFSLDDFGTGYSSMTYLQKLPFDMLKIDKSFVDSILRDGKENSSTKEILKSIIELAHNLELKVVSEGVEERGQLDWLREIGCDICQGYYTGIPMPKEEAIMTLGKNIYA